MAGFTAVHTSSMQALQARTLKQLLPPPFRPSHSLVVLLALLIGGLLHIQHADGRHLAGGKAALGLGVALPDLLAKQVGVVLQDRGRKESLASAGTSCEASVGAGPGQAVRLWAPSSLQSAWLATGLLGQSSAFRGCPGSPVRSLRPPAGTCRGCPADQRCPCPRSAQ